MVLSCIYWLFTLLFLAVYSSRENWSWSRMRMRSYRVLSSVVSCLRRENGFFKGRRQERIHWKSKLRIDEETCSPSSSRGKMCQSWAWRCSNSWTSRLWWNAAKSARSGVTTSIPSCGTVSQRLRIVQTSLSYLIFQPFLSKLMIGKRETLHVSWYCSSASAKRRK